MSKSSIEWTESTWNPITGCSKVSAGCKNCYAERMAWRLRGMGQKQYENVTTGWDKLLPTQGKWNGKTVFVESALQIPLKRKKACVYFVCSMSDLFHESVPFEWIDKVFAVAALCPQHTFQVLTKRPERMAEYLSQQRNSKLYNAGYEVIKNRTNFNQLISNYAIYLTRNAPLPNVMLGTTAENQEMADKRIPELLKCPAAKRFVSIEPMLGAVDLSKYILPQFADIIGLHSDSPPPSPQKLDWVICGGESGPGARPMHPDWARSIRDQCKAAGVPFFFKQWGKFKNGRPWKIDGKDPWVWSERRDSSSTKLSYHPWEHPVTNLKFIHIRPDGSKQQKLCWEVGDARMTPLGKKKAGCLLDGVEYKEMPE